MKKTIEEFKGVIPAVLSVFDEQENLNDSWTREFIRFLMSFPIGGLYLTGSTGETFLMDGEERMHTPPGCNSHSFLPGNFRLEILS